MKNLLKAAAAISIVLAVPTSARAFELRSGDLLFETEGISEFSEAISSSTMEAGTPLSFVHVGIAYVDPMGNAFVVEASPREGVVLTPLEDFILSAPELGEGHGVVVKRLKDEFPTGETLKRAFSHIGQPYDWYYLPDNGMMYCSELVYESYLSPGGEHIFKSTPMNFRNPDGSMPLFWMELYEKLGVGVPEGIPGTNPNGLSASPLLEEVYRYF